MKLLLAMPILFACFVHAQLLGQDAITTYLDKEVAAVAIISEPDQTLQSILNLLSPTEAELATIVRLISDESIGVFEEAAVLEFRKAFVQLLNILGEVDEIGFVLHTLEPVEVSILIRVEKPAGDVFERCCKKLITLISQAGDLDGQQLTDAAKNLELCFHTSPGWIVISNSEERGNNLYQRIGDNSAAISSKVLSSTRKYKRVRKVLESASATSGTIKVYGSPEKLSKVFFPNIDDKLRGAYEFDEIPAIGLRIDFQKQNEQPIVSLDFSVPFTSPRVGFGAMIDAHTSLANLPPLPFRVTDISAFAFDPFKLHETTKRIMDKAYGEGKYVAQKQQTAQRYSRDFIKDEVPRSNETIVFRYQQEGADRIDKIRMEKVNDAAAMNRYVKSYLHAINAMNELDLNYKPFQEKDAGYGGKLWAKGLDSKKKNVSSSSRREPGYFINDEWSVYGNFKDLPMQLDSIYGTPTIPQVNAALTRARKELGVSPDIFKIRFFGLWSFFPDQFERNRIREKHAGNSKKMSEVLNSDMNQFGYHMKIESRDDCLAVVKSLIMRSLARRLGGVVFFYSNEENRMRVKGGVYPSLDFREN